MSKWTNVCKVTEYNISTETKIGDEGKEEVMRQFRFWENYYLVLLYFFCFEWRVMNVKREEVLFFGVFYISSLYITIALVIEYVSQFLISLCQMCVN